jgi:hypothetical protein
MLVLNAGDSLDGVSTHATEVTCTLSGAEVQASGQITYKTLAQGQLAAAAASVYAPAAGLMAQISDVFLSNNNTVAETVALYVNGTAAANRIVQLQIPAGGSASFSRDGWRVYDATGAVLTGPGLIFSGAINTGARQTSGSLPTLTLTSGTGARVDTQHDRYLSVPTTTAGTVEVELSPDNTTYTALYTRTTQATDAVNVAVPAGWWVRLTATTSTLSAGTYY